MAKHLKLGVDPNTQNWALPDHADLEKLKTDIAAAMESDDALTIQVVIGSRQTAELVVNGGALVAALVWEDSPSGGGMTIID